MKFFEPTRITSASRPHDGHRDARGRGHRQHDRGDRDRPHAARPPDSIARRMPRSSEHQRAVEGEREQRRRDRAGEDHRRLDHRQAAEDVLAEPAGADRGRDRRGADADDRRDADAGDDRRQRERQLDAAESSWRGVMPSAVPASTSDASIERMPATVVRMIGSSA